MARARRGSRRGSRYNVIVMNQEIAFNRGSLLWLCLRLYQQPTNLQAQSRDRVNYAQQVCKHDFFIFCVVFEQKYCAIIRLWICVDMCGRFIS